MGNKHSATAPLDTGVNRAQRNRSQSSRARRRTRTTSSTVPPASAEYIDSLMHLRYKGDGKVHDEECPICAEQLEMDCVVISLPRCGHIFHSHCIVDWLNRKCTCPVCRFEHPTDNHGFEKARTKRMKKRNQQEPSSFGVETIKRREEEVSNNFDIILKRYLRTKECLYHTDNPSCSDSSSSGGFSPNVYAGSRPLECVRISSSDLLAS
jgi:hypothetical protein